MTGLDIDFTLDSTISAPYLTTRDEALPCSYTRRAEPTSGKCDIRETKAGELAVGSSVLEGGGDIEVPGSAPDDDVDVDGRPATDEEAMDEEKELLLSLLLLGDVDIDNGGRIIGGSFVLWDCECDSD